MDIGKNSFPFENTLSEVKLAAAAALVAGRAINKIYRGDFSVSQKEDGSPVSEADIASNKIICEILASSGYPILSEENADDKKRLAAKRVWIIDPLDGTADFIKRIGDFTVMIGLVENHSPIAGVIYQPAGDILYAAQKDQGAYFYQSGNWKKLASGDESELTRARAVMSRNHLSEKEEMFLKKLNLNDSIRLGSCLKVIAVAKGQADLYFTFTDKIKQWDTCASYILLKEAGGKMTDMLGNDIGYNTETVNHQNGILAANSSIHDKVVEEYKNFCHNR